MNKEMDQNAGPQQGRNAAMPSPEPVAPAISPGHALAKRREELNLTVQQVAGQLNLAPRQVEAIEADNFDALPGMAIARGFVRSYAKLLKIDAEPLLAAMAPAVAPIPDARPVSRSYISKPLAGDRLSFSNRSTKSTKLRWIILGIVAAGIALAAAVQYGPLTGGAEDSAVQVPDSGAESPQSPASEGRAVEVLPAPDMPAEQAPPTTTPPAAPEPSTQAPAAPMAAPVATPVKAPAVDRNALVLQVREQSWIEIKRADGAIVASRLFDAGAVETYPLTAELSLVVGNASGVDVSVRGEPLDLQAKARGNVARINVK